MTETTTTGTSPFHPSGREGLERKSPRLLLLVMVIAIIGIAGYIGFSLFKESVVYYKTPTEVMNAAGAPAGAEPVRLSGTVEPGSIENDIEAGTVSFVATDGTTSVPVLFEGPAPDTLKDRAQAIAEGTLGTDGVFHAKTLFAKCPSKFSDGSGEGEGG